MMEKRKTHGRKTRNGRNPQVIALNDLSDWAARTSWTLDPPQLHYCEPAWRWRASKPLGDFDFWLVLEGRGTMQIAGSAFDMEAGSWFLLQPGDQPRSHHDPRNPLVVFACHFQTGTPSVRIQEQPISGICRALLRPSVELAAKTFQEGATGENVASTVLRQIILQAVHALARKPGGSGRARLDTLAMEIRSAPGRNWSLAEMARRCALSPPHLNRLWRMAWGVTPIQYVIRQRIARAIQLLRESDLSIQQIADSLGYNDVFFFHRQFRRLAGTTPCATRFGAPTRLDDNSLPGIGRHPNAR